MEEKKTVLEEFKNHTEELRKQNEVNFTFYKSMLKKFDILIDTEERKVSVNRLIALAVFILACAIIVTQCVKVG